MDLVIAVRLISVAKIGKKTISSKFFCYYLLMRRYDDKPKLICTDKKSSPYWLNSTLLPAVRPRAGMCQAESMEESNGLAGIKKKSSEVSSTSIKMLIFAVFTAYLEYGREKISSIKFTFGVFFNKARFSANKCHLSENKWLLFRNKWHLLRKQSQL